MGKFKPNEEAVKKYTRKTGTQFKEDDVLLLLEEIRDTYIDNEKLISFQNLLLKKRLLPSTMTWWLKYSESCNAIYSELVQMRGARIEDALLSDNNLNATALIWVSKVKHKWVAEETRMKIESDKEVAQLDRDSVINIGWSDDGTDKS